MNIRTDGSPEATEFMRGYINAVHESAILRDKFQEFIESQGVSVWHLHDGWFTNDYSSGAEVIKAAHPQLTWISQHRESHSKLIPKVSEKLIIVKWIEQDRVITCHRYSIDSLTYNPFRYIDLKLSKLDSFEAVFNHEKNEFCLHIKFWESIYKKIRGIKS